MMTNFFEEYYWVYVLLSLKDNKKYTGYTKNLPSRFEAHQNGEVQSTKNRRPFVIIYFEGCLSQKDALKREKYLPRGIKSQILMQIYRACPVAKLTGVRFQIYPVKFRMNISSGVIFNRSIIPQGKRHIMGKCSLEIASNPIS